MVALRKQSAITERSFVSTWSGKTYAGWYLDGRMVGCSCPWSRVHVNQECKHRRKYNNQYEGCDHCGMNHKSWNCPF